MRRRPFLQRLGLATTACLLPRPAPAAGPAGADPAIRLVTVASGDRRFMGWPANNGCWSWDQGRELLVGYEEGPWVDKGGHKIGSPQHKKLARSLDGGLTWRQELPEPFVGRERRPRYASGGIDFGHPDLALRVAVGAAADPRDRVGRFFVSYDRGRRWQGPFRFAGLGDTPQLKGLEMTSRTDALVTAPDSALLLMSARDPGSGPLAERLDKTFVVRSGDGGRSFAFVSWVVPRNDPHRAVMPSTLRLRAGGGLITALRRMNPRAPEMNNWIDLYGSDDGGVSWSHRSRVGEAGARNGNPPGLLQLADGRLACAYGNRSSQRMLLRFSADDGHSWSEEQVVREVPHSFDFGYPRLSQNHRGDIVVLYYLSTREQPFAYIEAAHLSPAPPAG